jgi:hypothetical protein
LRNLHRAAIGNGEDSDSDEDEDVYQLPTQNLNSLQQKWSKKIQPLLFKFIGVTNRYPRRSGEDREAYYNRVHLIFLKENDGEKSFHVYQPAWKYLQDKPKFSVSCNMPSKRKEVITLDNEEAVEQHSETIQPMGRNSMKHKKEEEKILEAASQCLKSSTASVPSHPLTNILEQIAVSVGSALTTWTLHQALAYCSEDVQHQVQ